VNFGAGGVDGDGNTDIVTGKTKGGSFSVMLGNGLKSYSQPCLFGLAGNDPKFVIGGLAVADFNNDGLMDIAATGLKSNNVIVSLHHG
jgi:hypothetical protein